MAPNPFPDYLQNSLKAIQQIENNTYQARVAQWQAQANSIKATNEANQAAGLPLLPWPAFPKRTIYSIIGDGVVPTSEEQPALPIPVLNPPAGNESKPYLTGDKPRESQQTQLDRIENLLKQLVAMFSPAK